MARCVAGRDRRGKIHSRFTYPQYAKAARNRSGNAQDVLRSWAIVSWETGTIRKESTSVDPVVLDPTRMSAKPFLTNLPAAGALRSSGRTAAVQQLQELLSSYPSDSR